MQMYLFWSEFEQGVGKWLRSASWNAAIPSGLTELYETRYTHVSWPDKKKVPIWLTQPAILDLVAILAILHVVYFNKLVLELSSDQLLIRWVTS